MILTFVLLFAVAIGAWIWYVTRDKVTYTAMVPKLVGNGDFLVEVVGANRYAAELEKVFGTKKVGFISITTQANLIFDEDQVDRDAVRVAIKGQTIGYLPQSAAKDFRRAVAFAGLGSADFYECSAIIQGSWAQENGDGRHFEVRLDLTLTGA